MFRKVIASKEKHIEEVIDDVHLNGKITVCAFIVAKKGITNYINSDFNQDYYGIVF